MKETMNCISIVFDVLESFFKWFLGGADNLLCVLAVIAVIDCITGVVCANISKEFSLSEFLKGICKKLLIFTLIGISNMVDTYVLDQAGVLRNTVILFYLSTEAASVLKNADQIGLVIPRILKRVINLLREKGDEGDENSGAK